VLNTASTSDNINCPVTSYQVTPSILSSITQVNQSSCGSPENSLACRTLILDTAVIDVYSITYTLTAVGAPDLVVLVSLSVICGSNVVIIAPSPL
jgi:hypothetical protein